MLEDVFDETAHIGTHLYTRVFRDYIMGFLSARPINCKIFRHTFLVNNANSLKTTWTFPKQYPAKGCPVTLS